MKEESDQTVFVAKHVFYPCGGHGRVFVPEADAYGVEGDVDVSVSQRFAEPVKPCPDCGCPHGPMAPSDARRWKTAHRSIVQAKGRQR